MIEDMSPEIFSSNIADPETEAKVNVVRKRVEENSAIINRIVDQLVDRYSHDLDTFVRQVRAWIQRRDMLSERELELAALKIPIFMYFAAEGLESLGIEGDQAKAIKLETFNNLYLEARGTNQVKMKKAELDTFPEYLVEIAFSRAYKKLKIKLDQAEHVFSGAKKVLSKRMLELELNKRELPYSRGGRGED